MTNKEKLLLAIGKIGGRGKLCERLGITYPTLQIRLAEPSTFRLRELNIIETIINE